MFNLIIYKYSFAMTILMGMLTIVLLPSCVGTIEDKNPEITKGASADATPIKFEGVYEAVGIADTKIEVFFYPATLEPKNVTYLISYDGLSEPIAVPGTTLTTNYRGLLKYTVTGLSINSKYTFNVQAKDNDENISTSTAVFSASTFENSTADFSGIGSIRNIAGEDGRTALRVEWPAAKILGTTFYPNEIDPYQYQIVVLNAENLTPNAFDDEFFGEPNRKVFYVAGNKVSHQINGLVAGTKYYIRVRAEHEGYLEFGADVDYLKEMNSNYLLGQTLSDDASNVEVDLSSLAVEVLSLNSVSLEWAGAEGPVVEYRIYYRNVEDGGLPWSSFKTSRSEVCDGPDATYPEWSCKRLDYTVNKTKIADLESLGDYDIYPVICLTSSCAFSDSIEYENSSPYTMFPGIANFSGITSIDQPKYYFAVNEVYLNFSAPEFSTGAIDGILVEVKARTEEDGPVYDTILNHPSISNSSNLSVDNFDYQTDTVVSISGVSIGASEQYCFSLIPYIFNEGVVQFSRDGEVTECISPTISLPSELEFEGINFSTTIPVPLTNTITLNWTAPEGGVYDKFRIFIRDSSGGEAFNFEDAVDSASSDYVMVEVPYGTTSYTFSFLPNGIYKIGILPYYSNNDDYSPYNTSIYTFDTGD